jgi:Rps23 Pro-64 3,4-dihydroxylase Tpa1-like proline 4-hydroxylase
MDRKDFANFIVQQLQDSIERLHSEFFTPGRIHSCVVDDILPSDLAKSIYHAFPPEEELALKKSLREFKYIGVQMDRYNPILEEIVYAFQDVRVVKLLTEITGIQFLLPDESLYAGGISMMMKGHHTNPHLDNSHDRNRANYRVLNLLYYVTPDWKEAYGGNLELWDNGLRQKNRVIHNKFNRLVVMATHRSSWHSVNPVLQEGHRCCVSNYYFSPVPLDMHDYFHVSTFRGRPGQTLTDVALQTDVFLRSGIRRFFRKGIIDNPHVYKKNPSK